MTPISLKRLLDIHNESVGKSEAPDNLGDGFLLAANPVYRNVRYLARVCGYSFRSSPGAGALVFPGGAYAAFRDSKGIEYCDNVSGLSRLENQNPSQFMFHEIPEFRGNTLLADSARCVAWKLLGPSVSNASEDSEFLSLIAEGFATACEVLSSSHADSELHKIYLLKNISPYFRSLSMRTEAVILLDNLGFLGFMRFLGICGALACLSEKIDKRKVGLMIGSKNVLVKDSAAKVANLILAGKYKSGYFDVRLHARSGKGEDFLEKENFNAELWQTLAQQLELGIFGQGSVKTSKSDGNYPWSKPIG